MKILYKIIYCGLLIISQTLLAVPSTPTPQWTRPAPLYSTPDSQSNLVSFGSDGTFYMLGIDDSGNGTILFPPLINNGNFPNSFGGSVNVAPNLTTSHLATPSPLNGSVFQYQYSLSINSTGNGLAVWKMYDPTYYYGNASIQSALLNNGTWGTPTTLSNVQYKQYINGQYYGLSTYRPQVALHNDGSGIAVWLEADQTYSNHVIRYNLFDANGTWQYNGLSNANSGDIGSNWVVSNDIFAGNPLLLDTPTGNNNNNIKTYCVYQGTSDKIYITKLQKIDTEYSWTNPYESTSPTTGILAGAINTNGDIAVAYVNSQNGSVRVYSTLGGFSNEEEVIHNSWNPGPTGLAISIDTLGTITVLASVSNNNTSSVQVAQYIGGTWVNNNSQSFLVPFNSNVSYGNPCLAVDNNGNVFAVWEGDDITNNNQGTIYFNYFNYSNYARDTSAAYLWTYSVNNPLILSAAYGSSTNPSLKTNSNNAIVAWIKNNVTIEAVATTPNTYQPQTTWFECTNQANNQQC